MKKKNQNNEFNRIQRFSIRKYSFGAASVAIATYLMFMGNGAVYAAQEGVEGTEPKTLRNTNICDTNQCQYNLWDNWLVHKIV